MERTGRLLGCIGFSILISRELFAVMGLNNDNSKLAIVFVVAMITALICGIFHRFYAMTAVILVFVIAVASRGESDIPMASEYLRAPLVVIGSYIALFFSIAL